MSTAPRYFYKKEDKLKSRKTIEELFRKGRRFSVFPFSVIWLPVNNAAVLQTGIGVSSRYFKRAVDRNRVKRLMREAYRLQKGILAEQLQLKEKRMSAFILYTGKELPAYPLVFEKMGNIINRLIKCSDEDSKVVA